MIQHPQLVSRVLLGALLLGASGALLSSCDSASLDAAFDTNQEVAPGVEQPVDSPAVNGGAATPGSQGEAEPPPETERESSYRAPVVTGTYVWSANPSSGRVAVIDSNSFEVRSGQAGNQPSVVAGLEFPTGARRALVINSGSSDASLLSLDSEAISARQVPLHQGADTWSVSPDRRFAIAWTDPAKASQLDPTDGFQDITVVEIGADDALSATRLTVGYRPSEFAFDTQSRRAFGITEDGISIIDLTPGAVQLSRLVPLPSSIRVRPDVSITADGARALARLDGSRVLYDIDLNDGQTRELELDGAITDLDLSADGSRAVAVIRSLRASPEQTPDAGVAADADAGDAGPPEPAADTSEAVFIDLPAGLSDAGQRRTLSIPGSVALSADGTRAVLFSTALRNGRVTLVAPDLSYRSVELLAPVRAVFVTSDAAHAIALQDPPAGSLKKGAFSVLSLEALRAPKLVASDAPAELLALDPQDATRAVVTVSDPSTNVFGVYFVRMPSLQVDFSPLSSRPLSSGSVSASHKAFVAQQHPEGRITFIDLAEGQSREITGFELSAKVVDE